MTTTPFALVSVDRRQATPLHQQIYDGMRRAILDGVLQAGQRVPSTRSLAADLGVSRMPVLVAYEQLLHEGYLEGRSGSGTFVRTVIPDDAMRSLSHPKRPTVPPPRAVVPVVPARTEPAIAPFRVSLPGLDVFPRRLWARIVARHARQLTTQHMAYGDPAGLPALREAVADHLRVARAVRCDAHHVIIVSGSQAALRICAAVLLRVGDRVATEEPGYPGARAALGSGGAQLVPVDVDDQGISVRRLRSLSGLRAAYVTPSHQYPLGASMTAPRRLALLEWAARQDAWIIEDDYDSEFRYVSRPLAALQGMGELRRSGTRNRVVYVGTFSKVMFPALRLGYLVVPDALHDEFIAAREALDLFSPTLYQLALATFIREGHFARHLRRMRAVYSERRAALLEGLALHCDGLLAVYNDEAGLHVATLLPDRIDDVAVVRRLAEHGLAASALSTCYIGRKRESGLLLGFAGANARTIFAATRSLGDVLRASAASARA